VRSLSLALLLCFAAAAVARADTLNLRWDACLGDGGTVNRSFACNTNEGTERLVGSFVLASEMKQVSGAEIVMDVVTAGDALPAWWQFKNPGTCRLGAATWSTDLPANAEHCTDWASGQAVGGFAGYRAGAFGASSARVIGVSAVPYDELAGLNANTEYFAFAFVIHNVKTAGKDACQGCGVGACIALRSIKLATPAVKNDRLLAPAADDNDALVARRVTWQGGAGVVIPPGKEKLECSFSYRDRGTPLEHLLALY